MLILRYTWLVGWATSTPCNSIYAFNLYIRYMILQLLIQILEEKNVYNGNPKKKICISFMKHIKLYSIINHAVG